MPRTLQRSGQLRGLRKSVATSAAQAQIKAEVTRAVQNIAVSAARRYDLEHSMHTTLDGQLAAFLVSLILIARLPKITLDGDTPQIGGA